MKFKLVEAAESKICCICKKLFDGYGNNAEPVCSGSCCDECNMKEVIPARMKMLDDSSSEDIDEAVLTEDLEDYKITYYLSTATAERRPETIEDVENDWMEETFAADSDYDALLYALELIDSEYDDTDFSTVEEIVGYFEEKDLGDGSAFVVKLEGPNGVIYDMGQTKEDFIEQVKENDEMLSYYRSVLGIDESLNEGNSVSGKIPPALDSFLQDIAQMYETIDYGDIMDHDYTEDDIRKLNNLRRRFITWAQYDEDDEEVKAKLNEIADKVAEILKSNNLEEAIDPSKALEVKKNSDADVIFYGYQYKNEKPVEFDPPRELSSDEYRAAVEEITKEKTKLNPDAPHGNRYGHERNFVFYALYNRKNEDLNEGRFNPYFTPYGYRDAAKVLNRTAPAYYWHLKEIEMDRGDGIKLANYALKKGLPVMLDKNSDPDYPEFYLKDGSSEYHWGDYFYTYGFTNPDATQLVPYEGNLDILNIEKDDNKMNEDMSIRAKLKALYPELDFGDEVTEGFDDDMDFDIDESHETRMMDLLYEGSDDFDEYDDEAIDEFSDCEDDECWENDLISDDYDDATDKDYLDEDFSEIPESDEGRGKYIWKISFDNASGEYEATNDVDGVYAHGDTLKDCIEDLRALAKELAEIDGSVVVKKFNDKHVDYSESDLNNLGYVIVQYGRFRFW